MTRWWWFGGAATPDEISRELVSMRHAGLRGAELQPVYPLEPDDAARGIRNVPYFTDEWFRLLGHAAREAKRLGLQFDFTLGSGWPFGGPFIPVELSARRLRVLVEETSGPGEFTWELTPHLVGEDRVIAAVATPLLPSQQPDVSRSVLLTDRLERYGVPRVRTGLRLHRWPVSEGAWRIYLFVDSPTGMQVKRPTLGMEGFVLDHFSREATDLFLRAAGDRVVDRVESGVPSPFHSVFCDSLEVYGADWTSDLLAEFRQRRGYDLTLYLPALWQEAGPLTPHVRYDYHLTLSELMLDNFFRPLAEWSRGRGVQSRVQAHGAFADVIEAYALADIPEGETIFFGDRYEVNLRHRRLASSAAHLHGKPLVSAETYTWLRLPLFLVTLEMMKAATDAVFLDGINHIVNHGYPYSPPQAGKPGWAFYASTLINHNNLWWRHYPHLAEYVQRVSAVLREGVAVNPVAVYVPLADVFAKYGCGALHIDVEIEAHLGPELFLELRRAGYDFDLINDRALAELAKVEKGKLKAGTGEYAVVLVPQAEYMPPETVERLAQFAESGGQVIFVGRLPDAAPGLRDLEVRSARVRNALGGLRQIGLNAAANTSEALRALRARLTPDFQIVEAGSGTEEALRDAREHVGFVHRRAGNTDLFFVSNISSRPRELRVRFDVNHRRPERWNPLGDPREEALAYRYVTEAPHGKKLTEVKLDLEPFDSCFVLFGLDTHLPAVTWTNLRGPLRIEQRGRQTGVSGMVEQNGEYFLENGGGRRKTLRVDSLPEPIALDGVWSLALGEGAKLTLDSLRSWNELPEGKSYSGWARYECWFEMPKVDFSLEWFLDLGVVHETAEATLNGVKLGAAWKAPRRLACREALRAGTNHLVVDVANLWIHRILSLPKPDLRGIAETHGIRWGTYGEVPPESVPPSGLLGPVRLVPRKRVSVIF